MIQSAHLHPAHDEGGYRAYISVVRLDWSAHKVCYTQLSECVEFELFCCQCADFLEAFWIISFPLDSSDAKSVPFLLVFLLLIQNLEHRWENNGAETNECFGMKCSGDASIGKVNPNLAIDTPVL